MTAVQQAGRYPAPSPPIDYYALADVADLFRACPGGDPARGLAAFAAIVDRLDLRAGDEVPGALCCPGFGTRELAGALGWPHVEAARYTRPLEEAGVLAPLAPDGRGGARGWRLDLARLREEAGYLALATDGGD